MLYVVCFETGQAQSWHGMLDQAACQLGRDSDDENIGGDVRVYIILTEENLYLQLAQADFGFQ